MKAKKQLPAQLLENFTEQLERIFRNPEQGPFFASRVINAPKGYCLLNLISSYIESLKESILRIPQDIDGAKETANQRLGDARTAFISKDKKKDVYIDAKIQEYLLYADRERMEQMIEFYEDLAQIINDQNSRIYGVFTELLNALNGIFEKNGDILVNGDEQVDHRGNKTYYWNIVSVPDIEKVITNVMDNKSVNTLISDFSNELLRKSEQWVREQEVDIVSAISEFLSDQFGDLITKSMEEFLAIKYGQDEAVDKVVERIIAKRLDDEAIPVFHLSNSSGNFHFPQWGFVSVPADAPNIFKGILKYQEIALGHSRFTIKESQVKNRIFWLNTRNGIPLFSYSPLKVLEESYERTILEQEGIGRHLVQTDKINWTYLPSPIPEKSWGDVYNNSRVKQYNSGIRGLFDKAAEFRIIVEKSENVTTTSRYELVLTKAFQVEQFVKGFNHQLDSGKPNHGEIRKCLEQLKGLLKDGLEREGARDIFGSINEEMAKENLIRSPELLDHVRKEIAKYEAIAAKIAELEQFANAHSDMEKLIDQFIEAMYTKTICKKGTLYVYDHEADEEAWEPLVNLMRVNKFVDYAIFEQLSGLDNKKRELLQRKSAKRSVQLSTEIDTSNLLLTLREMAAAYQEGKSALDYDRSEWANGEEMYSFYQQVSAKVNDIINKLK